MENLLLENKVAIITGAAGGTGREGAIIFAKEGAKVCVADVNIEQGEETVHIIEKAGGEAFFVRCDVTNEEDVKAMVQKTVMNYGKLDCAYNNSGILLDEISTVDLKSDTWDKIMNVNAKGVWLCMKYEIAEMLNKGNGAIVNTSSLAGISTEPCAPAYTASKHAVLGLTKSASRQYASQGIRINAICPGLVLTPMWYKLIEAHPEFQVIEKCIPLNRGAHPDEVAYSAAFLCSDHLTYCNGIALTVDGGLHNAVFGPR